MKNKFKYPKYVIKMALMSGVIMVVAPALSQIPQDIQLQRFLLGLPIGAIVGAVMWPIGDWYRRREHAAIRQMKEERDSNIQPISGSQ